MKITIEIPDEHVNGALAAPHSRYWASEARWNPDTRRGYVVEVGDGTSVARHALGPARLRFAIASMPTKAPKHFGRLLSGLYDGETGDVLLQLMVFGELKYG